MCIRDRDGSIEASAETGPSDATRPRDAPEEEAATESGPSLLPCTATETPLMEWTFDASTSGWTLSIESGVQATITWTAATGNPSPGAVRVDVTPRTSDAQRGTQMQEPDDSENGRALAMKRCTRNSPGE